MVTYQKPPRKRKISREKISRRFSWIGKEIYHLTRFSRNCPRTILFILGCQRSGTDLLTQIFDVDLNSKVYPEVSKLSSQDLPRKLRLNPLSSVKDILDRDRAPLIVLKPLVESQNTIELLNYFPTSKALWMYRNYRDVVASHVKKWGGQNSIRDLRAIVEQLPDNWRYEKVTDRVRAVVLQHFSEDMDAHDAAALYWFVRNNLFFDLNLNNNRRVKTCKYEELVTNPIPVMESIYEFLGRNFPGSKIVASVHSDSLNKGKVVRLSPEIEVLCANLLERLDQAHHS